MYNHSLGELPLDKLLAPGGIVAVWCTNANSNLSQLKEDVFPQWGIKQIAQWMWLKVFFILFKCMIVASSLEYDMFYSIIISLSSTLLLLFYCSTQVTQSGELVCPFSEPPGKQPFEQLVFGVRPDEIGMFPRPDDGKIFMSVPSAIHSHKPPISGKTVTAASIYYHEVFV